MMHPKGVLIERCQALGLKKPEFNTKRTGPEHEPTFITDVIIQGEVYGTGQGSNKRDAEKNASTEALTLLEREGPPKHAPRTLEHHLEPVELDKGSSSSNETPVMQNFETSFEGPWPVFAHVLAKCLEIADNRVDGRKKGESAIQEVLTLATELYKGSLEKLGEIEEVDEDDDEDDDSE